jgi:hypothetical protein
MIFPRRSLGPEDSNSVRRAVDIAYYRLKSDARTGHLPACGDRKHEILMAIYLEALSRCIEMNQRDEIRCPCSDNVISFTEWRALNQRKQIELLR